MKQLIILVLLVLMGNGTFAQQSIVFHVDGTQSSYPINESDSLYFNDDHTLLYFFNDGNIIEHLVADIDSMTLTSAQLDDVYIDYQGSSVNIQNPYAGIGVDIEVDGAFVTVTAATGLDEINYVCSGSTSNGGLKIYSDDKFSLLLNGLDITNPVGPAINIQSAKRGFIHLLPGTENVLTDGTQYDSPVVIGGVEEDQKAALFSEGKLKFIGSGSLTVNGSGSEQHAIRSDSELIIYEGEIMITSSANDGIHADGFIMEGGSLTVISSGDGIDGDQGSIEVNCGSIEINSTSENVRGMTCEGLMSVNGGDISMNISGDRSNGMKCDSLMVLNGGAIYGSALGGVVLDTDGQGFTPSYCTLIKADQDLLINGAVIEFETTGEASRGISCDGNMTILSGEVTILSSGDGDTYTNALDEDDAYYGTCIKVDGNLTYHGGILELSNSGSGGRGVSVNGAVEYGNGSSQPQMTITTTGESITITPGGGGPGGGGPGGGGPGGSNGDYDESKALKADGAITINSGVIEISSADDAIKSNESITFNDGSLEVTSSVEGLEAPFITINDGTIEIAATDDGINSTQGEEVFNDDGSLTTINGGNVTVNMSGNDVDAIDSNGDIVIVGGVVHLNFPTQGPSSGLDANGSVTIGPDAEVYENGQPL